MLRRSILLFLAAIDLLAVAARTEAASGRVRVHVRHVRRHLSVGPRRPFPVPEPPTLVFPPPDEATPPAIEEPSAPLEEPSESLQLPHGFTLTVPVRSGRHATAPASLGRFVQVGQALGACWSPPAMGPWSSITLRVSFKRNGSVNGVPRIPYIGAASPEQKSGLAQSLLAALKTCTPLPFSASLGAAIAGEIFAIRFVNEESQ